MNEEKSATKPLLQRLAELYPESKRSRFRQWIRDGRIRVDGALATDPRQPVPDHSRIELGHPEKTQPRPLRGGTIVYQDNDLILVDKEPGFLSVPAPAVRKEHTLYGSLERYLRRPPLIVHRLDRDTSGLILYAKTERAQKRLQKNWQEAVQERIYLAVVEGEPAVKEGTLRSYLKENKAHKMYVTDGDGALAILHYRVLQPGSFSLVRIELETGRKNQIRAQFEALGHPVAGDARYGARTNVLQRLGLHAHSIRFRHPITDETLSFESPAPPSFQAVVSRSRTNR